MANLGSVGTLQHDDFSIIDFELTQDAIAEFSTPVVGIYIDALTDESAGGGGSVGYASG